MQVIADPEAELIVAGSVVYDPECIPDVRVLVSLEDFVDSRCRAVYQAALSLTDAGRNVDGAAVLLELRAKGLAEELGSPPAAFLGDLHSAAPTAVNADYAATRMKDAAVRRRAEAQCLEAIGRLRAPTGPADEMVNELARRLGDLADYGAAGETTTTLAEEMIEAGTRYEQLGTPDGAKGITSGFTDVNDLVGGGFRPGELVLIGGRPGAGKSIFIRQTAVAAAKEGVETVLFSLEMARSEVTDRIVADAASIDFGRLRRDKRLPVADVERFARLNLNGLPLRFEKRRKLRVSEIAATTRRLNRKHGTRLVVIDYLQLIEPESRKTSRYEAVGEISRTLKLLAGDLDVVVIAAVQVSRAAADEKIALHHLRESGNLEQDGDLVILLSEKDAKETKPSTSTHREIDFIIAKQRNGIVGVEVPMQLVGQHSRFEPYTDGT